MRTKALILAKKIRTSSAKQTYASSPIEHNDKVSHLASLKIVRTKYQNIGWLLLI